MMVKKPLIIRSILGETIERLPVWLMRQAGRYLPEYRAMKEQHTFLELCSSPELAFEVSMQPMRRFPLDASIVFSDILFPCKRLGFEIDFNPGPVVKNAIKSPADILNLSMQKSDVVYRSVYSTISALRKALDPTKAVLGFAGSPWTLACYLLDQHPFKQFLGTQVFAYKHRKEFHQFLSLLTDLTIEYLQGQVEAGADAVQLFDTWGGMLNRDAYEEFSFQYNERIFEACNKSPTIFYLNSGTHLTDLISNTKATCLSLDWRIDPQKDLNSLPTNKSIQGNFNPTILFAPTETIEIETQKMLKSFNRKTNYVANLGHGVLVTTPISGVETFINTVMSFGI
jgi:uroporphyrinogen decarboxylase